jgi:hypothetical protein
MPRLCEVSYSREATIAAVSDYFDFLASMYVKKSAILRPPEGGWPGMTVGGFQKVAVEKTDEAIALLRHLPYLARLPDGSDIVAGPPGTGFFSWRDLACCQVLSAPFVTRFMTEGLWDLWEGLVPRHIIGLARGNCAHFWLDTRLGIIYWPDCPDGIRHNPSREPIHDAPYQLEHRPGRALWRVQGPAWTVVDFFELLKDQFRCLHYVPFSNCSVFMDKRLDRQPEDGDGDGMHDRPCRNRSRPSRPSFASTAGPTWSDSASASA